MEATADDQLAQPLLPPRQCSASPEPVSSELEEVLSNTEFPILRRILTATLIELGILLRIAGPAVVVYFLNSVTSLSTTIFCGHIGNLELAAAALGNAGTTFAYGLMVINYLPVYQFGNDSKYIIIINCTASEYISTFINYGYVLLIMILH